MCSAINSVHCHLCEIYIIHTYSINVHTSHCDICKCSCEPCLTPIPSSTICLQQTDPDLIRNNAKLYIQPIYRTNKFPSFSQYICVITHILRQYISQIFYFIFPLYTFSINIHLTLWWTCIFTKTYIMHSVFLALKVKPYSLAKDSDVLTSTSRPCMLGKWLWRYPCSNVYGTYCI